MITGCDAIHPGYGFLAENARFAEICADHGLIFIGPRPSVIAAMGDKATAKRVMREAGVATIPGSDILPTVGDAVEAAARLEYPVLLKATAGGGGKGMRVVERPEDVERAFASATAESEASFKDGRLYMEKLISNPRHVEVQVLADEFGSVVHLGERDCSAQKPSHQKMIEESPAPNLPPRLRAALHDMAVRACERVGYTNAGTLEFLTAGDDAYFMEMNTRIQVEHPVTEMVYGIDLVKEQIRIAAGEPLGYVQRDLVGRGHAIECRINAEDPRNNFTPASGLALPTSCFPAAPAFGSIRTSIPERPFHRTTIRCSPKWLPMAIRAMPRSREWNVRCAKRSSKACKRRSACAWKFWPRASFARAGTISASFPRC